MTATGIHLLDLSVRLMGAAESVLCICEQLSSDLPNGDTVAAFIKFKGGGTSYVSASLANPFMSRFTVYGSKGWIDIRDKAHVESPDGWIVTSAMAGGPITTVEVPPAEPVKDNLVSFARAVRGTKSIRSLPRIWLITLPFWRRSLPLPCRAKSKPWPEESMMKALIFDAPKKPLVTQVQMPTITENEVMIRTSRVGICHSDYELLAGQYIIPISYPVTPGHEWVGEVVEVGRNVNGLRRGDRVVGECVIKTPERIHHFGFSMDGANREFFAARPEWLHKLPDAVDDAKGALIEPFTCGYYAVMRNGGINASETVVISGGGTIGLVSAAAAIGMGARVIVVDPVPLRRNIAMRLGADATVDPSDGDAVERGAGVNQGRC